MPREQVLYQILKFDSTFICDHKLNIESYTPKQAAQDSNLVSCGDNIAFEQARFIHNDTRDYHEIFKDVCFLRSRLKMLKREGKYNEANIIWQKLLKTLYVEDFISVEAHNKSEYRKIAYNGFIVNGKKYIRFSASAGQIRHDTVLFVSELIYPELYKRLMCGLDERVKSINIAKLSAYFSLSTSSVLWVDTPRAIVIKDFFTTLKNQKIDWIDNVDIEQDDGSIITKKSVEERFMDITMNSCDGQGLISPAMAQKWSENMGLDYIPSSFVVRTIWTKGNLVPFDFHEYAKEYGINIIYDRWNIPHRIEDVDVLLSESQFKQYKYYSSYEDYTRYTQAAQIHWGVARYNRKYDDEWVLGNYQIFQVLDINKDEIKELIQPTIDWIKKVCTGDPLYALLYSIGGFSKDKETITYEDAESRAQNLAMRAVIKNPSFLKDSYVQKKIYRNIVESIKQAKIGKIWVRGNYSFMISDPIAQCRSALGLDPIGEIPSEHIYSNFWAERKNIGDDIILCRSPLLDKHEVNHCALHCSPETSKWYKWIKSGIIFSIYDLSTLRHSDSDFDGDLVMSSDNHVMRKGSLKDITNPITYEKSAVPSHAITYKNFVETDIRGFGTKVGTYSNYSTIIEAMRPMFQGPDQTTQNEELLLRKKLLREINGQEIDRIKGVDAKGPPKDEWLKMCKVFPEDSPEVKKAKYYHNSLVLAKKPYFFRYLYEELNTDYKKHENNYNISSLCTFGIRLKKLLAKQNKTDIEKAFVRKYYKTMPVLTTDCTMNIMCRMFEDVNFDIQYRTDAQTMLPHLDLSIFDVNPSILNTWRQMYRKFCNKKPQIIINQIYSGESEDEYKEMSFNAFDMVRDELKNDYEQLHINAMDALTYIYVLSQSYTKFNWDFAWDVLGEQILSCIPQSDTLVPIESEDGEEFLGRKFKLIKISPNQNQENVNIDQLLNADN